jgi:virulence-associated protein VagC
MGAIRAKVFWSGGSQAVRLPKSMRLDSTEVLVAKRGKTLVLDPVEENDDWTGFWERLLPLSEPVRRWKTRRAERRQPI